MWITNLSPGSPRYQGSLLEDLGVLLAGSRGHRDFLLGVVADGGGDPEELGPALATLSLGRVPPYLRRPGRRVLSLARSGLARLPNGGELVLRVAYCALAAAAARAQYWDSPEQDALGRLYPERFVGLGRVAAYRSLNGRRRLLYEVGATPSGSVGIRTI